MTRNDYFVAGLILCAGLSLSAPRTARAYHLTGLGFQAGIVDPEGLSTTARFAGHLEFEKAGSHLHLVPSVAVWSNQGVRNINPNFDLYYHINHADVISPYVGAGLGVHAYHFDAPSTSKTDIGANLFGGLLFPGHTTRFFLEGRYVVTDRAQPMLMAGLTFGTH